MTSDIHFDDDDHDDLSIEVVSQVEALLERYGLTGPPVDAMAILRREGHMISKRTIAARSLKRLRLGLKWVELHPENRPEQDQFSCGHELGEILLEDRVQRSRLERVSNLFASELLMPTRWFRKDAGRLDLVALKRRYSTASHEAIAYQLLLFREGLVVTVVDNGRVVRRAARRDTPGALSRTERAVLDRVSACGRKQTMTDEGIDVQGYPIFDGPWRRVVLLAAPSHSSNSEI